MKPAPPVISTRGDRCNRLRGADGDLIRLDEDVVMKPVTISSGMGTALDPLPRRSGRRSMRLRATTVFALALGVRIAFLAGVVGFDSPPHDDAGMYDSNARSVSQGGPYGDADGYRSHRAPAYS